MTEYEKREINPCWQTKQKLIAVFTIDSHNTSYFWKKEDNTYYWEHARKNVDKNILIDANGIQLDLFGDPILSKEFIMREILNV